MWDIRARATNKYPPSWSKEKSDLVHYSPIYVGVGDKGGSIAKAILWLVSYIMFVSCVLFRQRLHRLKSVCKISLVKKYRDKFGQQKVCGTSQLRASAEYPVQMGLKARGFLF